VIMKPKPIWTVGLDQLGPSPGALRCHAHYEAKPARPSLLNGKYRPAPSGADHVVLQRGRPRRCKITLPTLKFMTDPA